MSIISHFQAKFSFKVEPYNLMRFESLANRVNEFDFDVFLPTIRNRETGELGVNLQRGLEWNEFQKRELIYSVLKGVPILPISIIDRSYLNAGPIYQVIDGKQRLTTLIAFASNEFAIEVNGKSYFYKDFDHETKVVLKGYYPQFNVALENENAKIADLEKLVWCKLINYGTPINKKHFDKFDV